MLAVPGYWLLATPVMSGPVFMLGELVPRRMRPTHRSRTEDYKGFLKSTSTTVGRRSSAAATQLAQNGLLIRAGLRLRAGCTLNAARCRSRQMDPGGRCQMTLEAACPVGGLSGDRLCQEEMGA
jgi:hypothetical protein